MLLSGCLSLHPGADSRVCDNQPCAHLQMGCPSGELAPSVFGRVRACTHLSKLLGSQPGMEVASATARTTKRTHNERPPRCTQRTCHLQRGPQSLHPARVCQWKPEADLLHTRMCAACMACSAEVRAPTPIHSFIHRMCACGHRAAPDPPAFMPSRVRGGALMPGAYSCCGACGCAKRCHGTACKAPRTRR